MRVWLALGILTAVGCTALRTGTPPPAVEPAEPDDDPLALAAECSARGDAVAACDHLERYVRTHPDQLMFRAHLAELLLKADRPERAKVHLERFAADAQDATGPPRAQLVPCHTHLMELAQQADDRFGELFHRGVGLLLLVEQQDAEPEKRDDELCEAVLCKAVKALGEAKELRPADPRVRFYLAAAHARLGNRRAADAERGAARTLALPDTLTPSESRRLALAGPRD